MVNSARRRVRAAVLHSFRDPFSVEETEVEVPDDWVEVEVKAVGICGRDIVVWKGGFRNLKTPLILGHEVYGTYNGKPVGVFPAIVPRECTTKLGNALECPYMVLGENSPGGYADKVYVPPWILVELPDREYEKYAAAVCGVATMLHAARVAGVKAGDKVLVTGASGGVGIHGLQLLKLLGAKVYAYTRSEEKARILRSLGVEAVTDLSFYKSEGRVDSVMELVGARTINDSMRTLRPGGHLVLIGNITGERILIERPALFVMREIHIHGSAAYNMAEYKAAIEIVSRGAIKPFYKTYKLEDINIAYKDALEGRLLGRAVLTP
ncbi:MAG: zinc-binding dehydrogenase [Desulfurococcales archaeon]|nr:zinc-binding dehydrogenase [Desulfurococcales archaeon]